MVYKRYEITMKQLPKTTRAIYGGTYRVLPKAEEESIKKFAQICRDFIKQEIVSQQITWTKRMWQYTQVRKRKNGYVISMPKYAAALEKMRTHWVSLNKPGRENLQKWAQDKLGYVPRAIQVRAHPFIRPAMRKASRHIRQAHKQGYGKMKEVR